MNRYQQLTSAADTLARATGFLEKTRTVNESRVLKLQQGPKLAPESFETEFGKITSEHMTVVTPHLERGAEWRAQGDEAQKWLTPLNFAGAQLLQDSQKSAAAVSTVQMMGAARVAELQLHASPRDPVLVAAAIVAGETLTGQDRTAIDALAAAHYGPDLIAGHAAAWRLSTAPARLRIAAGLGEVHDLFQVEIAEERIARLGQPIDPQLETQDRAA